MLWTAFLGAKTDAKETLALLFEYSSGRPKKFHISLFKIRLIAMSVWQQQKEGRQWVHKSIFNSCGQYQGCPTEDTINLLILSQAKENSNMIDFLLSAINHAVFIMYLSV